MSIYLIFIYIILYNFYYNLMLALSSSSQELSELEDVPCGYSFAEIQRYTSTYKYSKEVSVFFVVVICYQFIGMWPRVSE